VIVFDYMLKLVFLCILPAVYKIGSWQPANALVMISRPWCHGLSLGLKTSKTVFTTALLVGPACLHDTLPLLMFSPWFTLYYFALFAHVVIAVSLFTCFYTFALFIVKCLVWILLNGSWGFYWSDELIWWLFTL